MSSLSRRHLSRVVLVGAFALATQAAQGQDAGGAASTTIPTLRGAIDTGPDGTGPAPPLPTDGGVGSGAQTRGGAAAKPVDPNNPPSKFLPPKGTAKTVDRARVPRVGPPPLPTLEAYPTALRLRGGGAAIDTIGTPTAPGPTVATLPFTARLRNRIEDSPYDPIGVDVGSLRLTPSVTQSFGYDSNPDQTQTGVKGSAYSRTEGSLGVVSTWSRNEFRASFNGGYNTYFSDPQADRPDATGTADYRYDLTRDAALDAEGRFALDTQRTGSPEVSSNATNRPIIATYGGSIGGTDTFGRTTLALHGSIDRTDYQNATDSTGVVQDLSSQDFNDYGLRLRATYEVTPVFRPFVDLFADDRIHDQKIDYTGYDRNSTGLTGQLGSSFEITRLITGEISGGYGQRSYEDPRLKNIDGPVFNGLVAYAVTPLTTISFRAATSFDETTVVGSSGTESRSATVEISHALLRNLSVTGALSYLNTKYVGVPITENTLAETLKAEYHLSRSLVATATFSHEKLNSTLAGASFDQDIALLGLRWQR